MSEPPRAYTSLRVTGRGVVLFDQHLARLARAGKKAIAAYRQLAGSAAPGIYAIRASEEGLDVRPRGPSALVEGMPARFMLSPFAGQRGQLEKPAPPSPYDSVRAKGIATLLTSADGREIYESCVASVLSWDGSRLIAPPPDRPAVRATALHALEELLAFEPVLVQSRRPLALINAVAGCCAPLLPGRDPFPDAARAAIASIFERETKRA